MGWANQHIEKLNKGETVEFRPKGNSMQGKVESGDLCTVEPFKEKDVPKVGDIVLCKVNGKQYLHLVKAVKGDQFQIGNNKGHVNGWTHRKQLFGRLAKVQK